MYALRLVAVKQQISAVEHMLSPTDSEWKGQQALLPVVRACQGAPQGTSLSPRPEGAGTLPASQPNEQHRYMT